MSFDSMLYTIGTALDRAQENGFNVQVLVEGQWVEGQVAAVDGHGVVLDLDGLEHSVVKMDRIAAVRVMTAAPMRQRITTGVVNGLDHDSVTVNGAMPMPGPMPAPRHSTD